MTIVGTPCHAIDDDLKWRADGWQHWRDPQDAPVVDMRTQEWLIHHCICRARCVRHPGMNPRNDDCRHLVAARSRGQAEATWNRKGILIVLDADQGQFQSLPGTGHSNRLNGNHDLHLRRMRRCTLDSYHAAFHKMLFFLSDMNFSPNIHLKNFIDQHLGGERSRCRMLLFQTVQQLMEMTQQK